MTKNIGEKLRSQLKIIFFVFKALCSKTDFSYFQKKKWPHFSKMDILKMSNFGKSRDKFIQLFLCGLLFMGTYIVEI